VSRPATGPGPAPGTTEMMRAAVAAITGPGDRVVASVTARRAGLSYAFALLYLLCVAGIAAGAIGDAANDHAPLLGLPFAIAGGAANIAWLNLPLTSFVAVTEAEVLSYRIQSRFPGRSRPGQVALRAPRSVVTVTSGRGPLGRVVRISAPGQPPQALIVSRRDRPALDRLLASLRAD
jgi:hypothetical protein